MSNIREIADSFDKIIKEKDIEKYKYTLTESEKRELNIENGDFKLFRTVFSNSGSIKVFKDNNNELILINNLKANDLLAKLSKYDIEQLLIEEIPLEDLFMNYYK